MPVFAIRPHHRPVRIGPRGHVVDRAGAAGPDCAIGGPRSPRRHVVPWSKLLKRTFQIDTICPRCQSPLRLFAMSKTADTIKKILSAMGLPTEPPKLFPARPPPAEFGGEGGDWFN